MKHIPLIKPYITDDVKTKVCEVLDSGYLTEGPVTRAFEDEFNTYIGSSHSLAVTSCTTGLELALRALGIGAGDEVIVPDYTYPATADAVAIVGADIVIVDVSRDTMLIDYDRVETAVTERTKAIIPVSIFGNPLDYERLNAIKAKRSLYIIEDAACSIGASFDSVRVGRLADISVFSLHPRKFITTGEGGVVTTDNPDLADWMTSYKNFGTGAKAGRLSTRFERIGTNYKLSNILAAVGLAQMEHIDELLARRITLSQQYLSLLSDITGVSIPGTTPRGQHAYQSFCVFIENRDHIMTAMREKGIEVQIGTYALHKHPAFKPSPNCRYHGEMDGSRYAFDHCLALPLYHELKYEDQQYIVDTLLQVMSST